MSKTEIVTPETPFQESDRQNMIDRRCRIGLAIVKTVDSMNRYQFIPSRVDCDTLRRVLREVSVSETDAHRLGLDAYGA